MMPRSVMPRSDVIQGKPAARRGWARGTLRGEGGLVRVRTVLISSVLALALLAVGCAGGQAGGGGGGDEGGGGGGGGATEVRPALVLDVGGLGDQSFNDSAYAGLQRAKQEFDVETEHLESSSPTDYVDNLTQLADSGYNPESAS